VTLRLTVFDVETGDFDEAEVESGDYFLVCHDPCRLAGVEVLDDGETHVVRIEGRTG
jgi:hypothetical protein